MVSGTLSRGLREYAVGPKLRALRLRKKMGLVELGRHTGLSAAMISKVERGVLFPTLPTLLRIALVFGVGLDHFFTASADAQGVRHCPPGRTDPLQRDASAAATWRGSSSASTSRRPSASSTPTG